MILALTRRAALLATLALTAGAAWAAGPADAAPVRTYAIVSLIGDEFSVVSRRPDVGTRLDPNERRLFPVPDPVFDRIAAAEAERAIRASRAGTPVLRTLIRDPRLFVWAVASAMADVLVE